ncbi:MAG: glycosyltransferase [Solobacterium sp.]|nr:glycosyltransferase [Solobacterium sp.]
MVCSDIIGILNGIAIHRVSDYGVLMDLSVIVPIYNVEKYLTECLDSIGQAFGILEAEVILVDDGSTDRSSKIAKDYAKDHLLFHYFRKENGGVSSARNFGVQNATGKYIAFVDGDDLLTKNIYADMFEAAERNGTDLTICHAGRIQDKKVTASPLHLRAFNNVEGSVTHITESPQLIYDTSVWNKLIRRDFYESHGFSWPEGFVFEDIPVSAKMHFYANNVTVIRETGYLWRIRGNGEKSLGQDFTGRKSFDDKITMLRKLFVFMDNTVRNDAVRTTAEQKAVSMDFAGYLNRLSIMKPEQAAYYIQELQKFFLDCIRPETVSSLKLIHKQIYTDVVNGDTEHLLRTVNYSKLNYENVPLALMDGQYRMQLPGEIFTIDDRSAANEFRDVPPSMMITAVAKTDTGALLKGYVYFKNLPCPDSDAQKLRAYLLNDITGAIHPLNLKQYCSSGITADIGSVINRDDYREYSCCYDGAGFEIEITTEDINGPERFIGRNKLIIAYENNICGGTRIARGYKPGVAKILQMLKLSGNNCLMSFGFDQRGTLNVNVAENNADYRDLISIIIPVYNAEKTLVRCLESMRKQTYKNLEIMLLNDGSDDSSETICREYAAKDKRFHVYNLEHVGVAAARNFALEHMNGDWFMFADADDLVCEQYADRLHQIAVDMNEPVVTCLAKDTRDTEIAEYTYTGKKTPRKITLEEYDFRERFSHRVVWGAIYRRDILGKLRFRTQYQVSTDTLFSAELLKKTGYVIHTDEELYCYILYPQSVAHGEFNRKRMDNILVWEKVAVMFVDGPELPFKSALSNCITHSIFAAEKLIRQKDYDPKLYYALLGRIRGNDDLIMKDDLTSATALKYKLYSKAPQLIKLKRFG